ncbi:MAG: HD domain-containing phosphohydrolase [candidate division NC10 bacterium]
MTRRTEGRLIKARLPLWRRLGWRLGASFLLVSAVGIFLAGHLQYRSEERVLRRAIGLVLLNVARTGAVLIDGELHESVVKDGSKDTVAYENLRKNLRQIQQANELDNPVYTLYDVQGSAARFAVISEGEAAVGKEYVLAPEIRPILHRVMEEGKAAYTDIYTNEHGTWFTAFAPIRNAAGKTVAALDVDFRAGNVYVAELGRIRRNLYLYSLAGALLALVAGLLLAQQITRPVAQLSRMARRVVEGDLTTPERVKSQDEIGLLGNLIHLMVERVHASHRSVVNVLVRVLQARDEKARSLPRLAGAALALGDRLELSQTQREALELGALLHDIGEVRTSRTVLQKAGPLTPDERRHVEHHPEWGAEIIETVPLLTPAIDVVGGHHERYDGTGYPQGLRGEDIPLTARIFAVVDALDAMTHDRPYRRARPVSEALEELHRESGKQFDPRVVDAALTIPPERWKELLESQAETD